MSINGGAIMKIQVLMSKYFEYAVKMRREFHMYPETAFNEFRTQKGLWRNLILLVFLARR